MVSLLQAPADKGLFGKPVTRAAGAECMSVL